MARKLTDKTIFKFVLGLIILKPIFDLGWSRPLFFIGSVAIPIHRVVAFAVPAIITIILVLRLLLNTSVRVNNNIFAFFVFGSITITLGSYRNLASVDEYIRMYSFVLLFLSVPSLIGSKQEFQKIAKWLLLISLVPTFIAYLETFHLLPFTYWDYLPVVGRIGRATGGYHHPSGYTNYLLVLIPLAIYLSVNKLISKRYFWFWFLATLPMVARSLHRATIVLVLFQIAIFIFFLSRTLFKFFVVIVFFAFLSVYAQQIWQLVNAGGAITEVNFRGRFYIWPRYINYFLSFPFSQRIFGLGSPHIPAGSFEPHSDWIRVMMSYGYLGLIAYASFLFSIFSRFFRNFLKIRRQLKAQSEALISLILVLTIVLYSVTMEPMRYSNFSWNCALVLGFTYMTIVNPKKMRLFKK